MATRNAVRQVRYVGAFDAVEVAATGQICRRGDVIGVPADVAGQPPNGKPGTDGYDPGSGLLAQVGNWVPVDPPKA